MTGPPNSSSSHSSFTASTSATATSCKTSTMEDTASTKTSRFSFGKSKSKASVNNNNNSSNDNKTKKATGSSSLMKLPKLLSLSNKYPRPKIVKDSIPLLDEELHVLTQDAPFIDAASPSKAICLLDRKEVQVGELLGQGQFASVFNVTEFSLRPEEKLISSRIQLSKDDLSKRESFVQDFTVCQQSQSSSSSSSCSHNHHNTKKCHRYAIKHLKRDLLVAPGRRRRDHKRYGTSAAADGGGDSDLPLDQQFQLAAADLIVEALYLSRLRHPHIMSIRGMAAGGPAAFSNGRYDSYFLILDKLSETLHQRIRHWKHTMGQPRESQLQTKTHYAYQMAQALEYLHEQRIIFRDLKPSNIGFKEEDDQLQIFDFGLCRELPKSQHPDDPDEVYFMTAAGTHRYMAVEILKGEKYSLKADTYSFAMVFYELLAQEAPFSNLDEADHEMLVCERKHRPHHFFGCVVPQSIQKLLGDAWEHEIKDRLSMSQVVSRLEDILTNTFHRELRDGPDGVKILQECDDSEEETAPTKTLVLAEGLRA